MLHQSAAMRACAYAHLAFSPGPDLYGRNGTSADRRWWRGHRWRCCWWRLRGWCSSCSKNRRKSGRVATNDKPHGTSDDLSWDRCQYALAAQPGHRATHSKPTVHPRHHHNAPAAGLGRNQCVPPRTASHRWRWVGSNTARRRQLFGHLPAKRHREKPSQRVLYELPQNLGCGHPYDQGGVGSCV